jgi:hypothetical protein
MRGRIREHKICLQGIDMSPRVNIHRASVPMSRPRILSHSLIMWYQLPERKSTPPMLVICDHVNHVKLYRHIPWRRRAPRCLTPTCEHRIHTPAALSAGIPKTGTYCIGNRIKAEGKSCGYAVDNRIPVASAASHFDDYIHVLEKVTRLKKC